MISLLRSTDAQSAIAIFIAGFFALAFAISFHEFAHAFVAHKSGDMTPKAYGRLSINPFCHFDTWGTLMMLIFGFGWAKPVPIDVRNFKKPRLNFFLVSIAGILANLFFAFLFMPFLVLVVKYLPLESNFWARFLYYVLYLFVSYNIMFAIFNILPIYPLDGFNVVLSLSKTENGYIRFMRQNGWIVLIVIVVFFSTFLAYPTDFMFNVFEKFWRLFI